MHNASSTTIAAAIGGALGGIFLLSVLYIIYRKRTDVSRNVWGTIATTADESIHPTSHEKQSRFGDIEHSPPALTYHDNRRTSSSPSVPRDSRQLERSTSPQFDTSGLSHPSATPLALSQHGSTTSESSTTTRPISNMIATTNTQEEAELIRHLYTLNMPTAEIGQLVESMRAERERLAGGKMRDEHRSGSGAGSNANVGAGESLARGANVRSTEEGPPPVYDFKSQ
jgi:hypothetical protein